MSEPLLAGIWRRSHYMRVGNEIKGVGGPETMDLFWPVTGDFNP